MNRKVKIILSLILIITTISVPVYADPNYNFDAIKNANTATKSEIDKTTNAIGDLDGKLAALITEMNKNKDKETELTLDIDRTNKQISLTENDLESKIALLNERTRAIYINGYGCDMLKALIESESLNEIMDKIEAFSKIIESDNKTIKDVKNSKKKLEQQKEKLQSDKSEMVALTTKNEEQQKQIINEKNQLLGVLSNLNIVRTKEIESGEVSYLTNKLKSDYASYSFPDLSMSKDVVNYKENLDFYSASDLRTPINVKPQDLVMYASSLIGVTYLWGGNDAKGLDCSGFTKYVYKHFGIIIPRVADAQQNIGVEVPKEEDLQPGDLLFYGQPAHHVTMFVTKGYMIEAPYTGETVKISPIRPYTNAKRYINLTADLIKANTHIYYKSQPQPSELDDNVKISQ